MYWILVRHIIVLIFAMIGPEVLYQTTCSQASIDRKWLAPSPFPGLPGSLRFELIVDHPRVIIAYVLIHTYIFLVLFSQVVVTIDRIIAGRSLAQKWYILLHNTLGMFILDIVKFWLMHYFFTYREGE